MKYFLKNKKGKYLEDTYKRQKQLKMVRKLKEEKRKEQYEGHDYI